MNYLLFFAAVLSSKVGSDVAGRTWESFIAKPRKTKLRERTVRRVRAQLGHDRDHNALNRHFERERGIILDVNMIAVLVLPALYG
jgi:hypothetical protein